MISITIFKNLQLEPVLKRKTVFSVPWYQMTVTYISSGIILNHGLSGASRSGRFYPYFLSYPQYCKGSVDWGVECMPCCRGGGLCIIYLNDYSELATVRHIYAPKGIFPSMFCPALTCFFWAWSKTNKVHWRFSIQFERLCIRPFTLFATKICRANTIETTGTCA